MSADNWAICPRCLATAGAIREARLRAATDVYGKVPAEEYEQLRAEAHVPLDEEAFRTFREVYEFYGTKEGTVTAEYSGACETCGLKLRFKHEHQLYPLATETPTQ